ncbi:hypothetical protein [Streptomyces sp. SID12501]|uniref:Ig-like domain-containing protein n=1 Tax=Streptomyces sp. SID12501 TaxID=2706042 RepID=A0A6B3BQA5_9ACTN|nr:hypothetical protein [Streptomyces sp. SID12501]NEC86526.1 hypothetical protein [Streptomyces sp. SID12501]
MAIDMRRTGTALTALATLVTALSLAGPPALASGYASAVGPWSSTAALTGTDGQQSLIDVKVAADGTAFALWRNKAAGETTWEFQAAVRPAGSSTWGAAHTLATGRDKTAGATLVTAADGRATVAWQEGSYLDGSLALLAATYDPGTASWSDPATLTSYAGSNISPPQLAAASDGTLTAVWVQGESAKTQVMTATRAAGSLTWSTAEPLTSLSTDFVYDLGIAVAPDGAATAAWDEYDQFAAQSVANAVTTATRTSAAADWGTPSVVPGSDGTSGNVRVAMDAHDATTVLWVTADDGDGNAGTGDLKSATRTSPSGVWGSAQTVASSFAYSTDSAPLTAPDGDVTYVWANTIGSSSVEAVTRSASTGTWSTPKVLSTGPARQVSASIGGDGTVQAVWRQVPSVDNGDDLYLEWAVRAAGAWTEAAALNTTPVAYLANTDALVGQVAAGPDGRATVVWTQAASASGGSYTSQVLTQSQTLLVKPVITTAAGLTGTARTGRILTCGAAWTGTNATAGYAWLRDGKAISGATARTRTLTGADYKHSLACRVTVSNGAGSVSSTSSPVTVAVGVTLKVVTAPSITGTARVGKKLSVAHGTWSPSATSYTYVWKRAGKAISGATKSTYTTVNADRGKKITATVTAHSTGYAKGSTTTKSVTVR